MASASRAVAASANGVAFQSSSRTAIAWRGIAVVVDDEDLAGADATGAATGVVPPRRRLRRRRRRRRCRLRQRDRVKRLPLPSPSLAAVTAPPCRSTMLRTIARPSPSPPRARCSDWSPWTKRSKMWSSSSRAQCRHRRRRSRRAAPAPRSRRSSMPMCPAGGENLAALVSRLQTTWASRTGSPSTHTPAGRNR